MPLTLQQARDAVKGVIGSAIHPRRAPFSLRANVLPGEPLSFAEATGGDFAPFEIGASWGGMWGTTWFRVRTRVPGDWAGEEIAAVLHMGGSEMVGFTAEGLVWNTAGTPLQGLHHRHRSVALIAQAEGGEEVDFFVEAASNPTPKWHAKDWPLLLPDYSGPPLYTFDVADLVTVDRAVEALYLEARLVLQMAQRLPDHGDAALAALEAALAIFDPSDPARTAPVAGQSLQALLGAASRSRHRVTAVGHAHIDSAWLWPIRETKRKCARTFANQLRLMERYPEHHFACSQAVQYQWIKDSYPDLYAQIKARVAEGRWEPVGGMWVEPDTNVPSGESLVRQFVHGKRFFLDEFGFESAELWIPDVFGYSAALPQIARQVGVTSLITQKMSWNETNPFPYSTFWWRGHDGSRLLAHFPPANTYNGDFSPGELAQSEANFKDRDRTDRSLYPFGYGDGGGGPTAEMLEVARRIADTDGLPRIEIGAVAGFLDAVRDDEPDLATWEGELYLETHRATLTTHADVKLANRRAEEALRQAEIWSVAAGIDSRADLDGAWKLLLLQQFHDIIPGSSIHWVYQDAARDYTEVIERARAVADRATRQLTQGDGFTVFNPSSYDRHEVVECPDGMMRTITVPALSWVPLDDCSAEAAPVGRGDDWIDNGILRVTWNAHGVVTSVWDHQAEREVVPPGAKANLFQIHEDHPTAFDAWNVDRDYLDHVEDIETIDSIEMVDQRPGRAAVRFVRNFGDRGSRIDQVMSLTAGSRRIEFQTEVEWRERHRFLKVAFPVDIHSTRATYEIQHGHIERPTVENTSWDLARFEVVAHRWADLSEPGYGVALLNDGKYGHESRSNTIRLSLLRAPGYPDPEADQGHHRFTYALLPHAGDLRGEGRVVEEAEALNLPLHFVPGRSRGRLLSIDRPGVSIEAVKWADRRDGFVVRLCEVWGSRGPLRLTVDTPFESVTRTDLLERDTGAVAHRGQTVDLQVRPFELVTLYFSGGRPAVG